jgi:hypothetical protein
VTNGRDPLPPSRSPSACPPDEILVGWAEGRLSDAARDAVEVHAASCSACRDVVAQIAPYVERVPSREEARATTSTAGPPPERASRILTLRPRTLAVAAAVLVALGASVFLATRGPAPAPLDDDSRLVAFAAELRRERPDVFASFSPLSPQERRARVEPTRGGLVVFEPAGLAESVRPDVRWSPVRGVVAVRVTVRRAASASGTSLFERDATATPFAYPADAPALERGVDYEVEVSARGAAGTVSGAAEFRVATEADDAAFRAAASLVAERAPAELSDLARAHFAARSGRWAESEAAARIFVAAHPSHRGGAELLAFVLDRRGVAVVEAPAPR